MSDLLFGSHFFLAFRPNGRVFVSIPLQKSKGNRFGEPDLSATDQKSCAVATAPDPFFNRKTWISGPIGPTDYLGTRAQSVVVKVAGEKKTKE
ncbi:MAG: hypothetical protein GY788_08760 [bacterium]|nr:hypothetical protein [bacterium]